MDSMNKPGVPTLYEWAGGMQAFEKLFDQFYDACDRHVFKTAQALKE